MTLHDTCQGLTSSAITTKTVKEESKVRKLIFLSVAVVTAFLFVTSQASATAILPLFQSGANQASDEDREYLIDRVGATIGQLDVGDSMRGLINFNTINSGSANVGGLTGNNEFSGVFQIMAANITSNIITWVPDPAFEATWGAGAVVAMFEDSTPDFAADYNDPAPAVVPPAWQHPVLDDGTTTGPPWTPPSNEDVSVGPYLTEEAFIATATDGTHRMTIGYLGLPGEGMQGVAVPGALNVLNFFNFTSGSVLGMANLGLNLLWMDPAWDAILDINRVTPCFFGGPVDFAMSQSLRGVSDLDTPFEVSSNTNVSFDVTVIPEPATMILLGSGLLGLGGLVRRKMKKA